MWWCFEAKIYTIFKMKICMHIHIASLLQLIHYLLKKKVTSCLSNATSFLGVINYPVMYSLRYLAIFVFFNFVIYVTYWRLDIKMIFYTRNVVKYYSNVE